MKRLQNLSLRLRLTLLFTLLAATAWIAASVVAWHQTTHTLNELFDTQQMLFAKRLSTFAEEDGDAPRTLMRTPKKLNHGHLDDDVLAFAIFTRDGKRLMDDGDNGPDIPWHDRRDGFTDGPLEDDNDAWRFLWLTTPDGKYRIVVGQEWDYRRDLALDIVTSQLKPWLIALPLMLILLIVLLSYELRPLRHLTRALATRAPDAADPLSVDGVPGEVRPLVDALNQLFARTHETMARERRFTSDAAHELRSPLTALKVQTDVALLAGEDAVMRDNALEQLHTGIDRAARLVDQLLTLSRLDSLDNLNEVEPIPLGDLLQSAVMDIYHPARQAGKEVRLHLQANAVIRAGQPLLMSLLVRNLLDNAVRYSPAGSVIDVTLNERDFSVRDNGPGVSEAVLARLGERFYRPPGQNETGSGLGLSIVKRIAALHGMAVTFQPVQPQGFEVKINWS